VVTWEKGPEWCAKLVVAKAESPEGAESIRHLGLNREDLRTERATVLNQVLLLMKEELLRKDRRVLRNLKERRLEFSAACLAGLEDFRRDGQV